LTGSVVSATSGKTHVRNIFGVLFDRRIRTALRFAVGSASTPVIGLDCVYSAGRDTITALVPRNLAL